MNPTRKKELSFLKHKRRTLKASIKELQQAKNPNMKKYEERKVFLNFINEKIKWIEENGN